MHLLEHFAIISKVFTHPPLCDATFWISDFVLFVYYVFFIGHYKFHCENDSENGQNGINMGLPDYF